MRVGSPFFLFCFETQGGVLTRGARRTDAGLLLQRLRRKERYRLTAMVNYH